MSSCFMNKSWHIMRQFSLWSFFLWLVIWLDFWSDIHIFNVKKCSHIDWYLYIRIRLGFFHDLRTFFRAYSQKKYWAIIIKEFHNQTDTIKTKTFWNHSFSPKGFHGLRNKTFMCHSELKLRRESKKVGGTVTVMVFPEPKASWSQKGQNVFEISTILSLF